MRFLAFASDYDGTLAYDGKIDRQTLRALEQLKRTGRKLILVTGRELDELLNLFPQAAIFDCIVAENGALLYWPLPGKQPSITRNTARTESGPGGKTIGSKPGAAAKPGAKSNPQAKARLSGIITATGKPGRLETLTDPPAPEFVAHLRQKRVTPLSVGHSIVATSLKHKRTVVSTILEMELDLHVILNKDAIMVLPTGVTKGTGLRVALDELGIPPHNVVAVGDAENDDSLLSMCGFSVAVANAIPALKRRAHKTTKQEHGAGVVEIIEQIMRSDRG
ncbi:MAG TPA: HAD family hydrolase [Terriglobales bacterium]|nr:HAD family hydrolase [Terriglobales bacterium]